MPNTTLGALAGEHRAQMPDGVEIYREHLEKLRKERASVLSTFEDFTGNTSEADLALVRWQAIRRTLDEINAALRRLDDGTYGRCQGCSQPIPAARLEILPQARYCVRCQDRRENT